MTNRCQCPRYTTGDLCQNIMRGELINATNRDQQMPVSEIYNWPGVWNRWPVPEHKERWVNWFLDFHVQSSTQGHNERCIFFFLFCWNGKTNDLPTGYLKQMTWLTNPLPKTNDLPTGYLKQMTWLTNRLPKTNDLPTGYLKQTTYQPATKNKWLDLPTGYLKQMP